MDLIDGLNILLKKYSMKKLGENIKFINRNYKKMVRIKEYTKEL